MEIIHEAPKLSDFVPLSVHQSATPASFYSGPPVLHYNSDRCKVVVIERELSNAPALANLVEKAKAAPTNTSAVNGTDSHCEDEAMKEKVIEEVDVWVTSDNLLLFSAAGSTGISIAYPSISLHAIQSLPEPSDGDQQGLYMQLMPTVEGNSDEDVEPDSVTLTILPTACAPPPQVTDTDPVEVESEQSPVMALFTALSNCSNLHPDPVDPNDPDAMQESRLFQAGMIIPGSTTGGLPPAMPGSGGWITEENMNEYFDEDGNWIGGEAEADAPLGPGAGTIRMRDEDEEADGREEDADEAKWRRTL